MKSEIVIPDSPALESLQRRLAQLHARAGAARSALAEAEAEVSARAPVDKVGAVLADPDAPLDAPAVPAHLREEVRVLDAAIARLGAEADRERAAHGRRCVDANRHGLAKVQRRTALALLEVIAALDAERAFLGAVQAAGVSTGEYLRSERRTVNLQNLRVIASKGEPASVLFEHYVRSGALKLSELSLEARPAFEASAA